MAMSKFEVRRVSGADYRFDKMTPAVAGYLWQKMKAGLFRVAQQAAAGRPRAAAEEAPGPVDHEQRMRGICEIALTQTTPEEYEFVQLQTLRSVSRMEEKPGVGALPMPLMTDDGRWAAQDVGDDPALVQRIMMEALVVNLTPFLAEGGSTA
jgi:hypothetical protein